MSGASISPEQPDTFEFTPENLQWAEALFAKYPSNRKTSGIIPLLWQAQKQHDGWIPLAAIGYIAKMVGTTEIRVMEVATFYTMFNLAPVGKYFVQLCGTTPCMLRGSEDLKKVCADMIGPQRHITDDGLFSWLEVECLGACCNAPMVQINDDYYEDLTPENFRQLLEDLKAGKEVRIGSQTGRQGSCPEGGPTSLVSSAS